MAAAGGGGRECGQQSATHHARGGRGGVEHRDAVPLHDLPPDGLVRVVPGRVGGYPSVFGIAIHHHLPFWWDVGAVAAFSLAVYYAIHSRLGPEREVPNVLEAVSDAHQEDLDLGLAEPI